MKLYRMIYRLGMFRSKNMLKKQYGTDFWQWFQSNSKEILKKVISKTPDIGDSIFAFNYAFTPAYIAWYQALKKHGFQQKEIQAVIWRMNEQIIKTAPGFLMPVVKSAYLKGFRKKASVHQKRMKENTLHPYDYTIQYRSIDKDTFQIDITSCAMMRLCRDFDAMDLFPMVCRMDYMFANYMQHGFTRSKTLGDGDECCNCRYNLTGTCDWNPEKGFDDRK